MCKKGLEPFRGRERWGLDILRTSNPGERQEEPPAERFRERELTVFTPFSLSL